MIKKGSFVSVWDNGGLISTPCKFNTKTKTFIAESSDCDPDGCLVREYIEFPDGDGIEVCTECHEGILENKMVEGVGKHLHEVPTCRNCGETF